MRAAFCSPIVMGLLVGVLVPAVSGPASGEPTLSAKPKAMNIEKTSFGKTKEGQEIALYTLTNTSGLTVKVITYGATVVAVETPDRDGKKANITLGFPT